MKRITLSSKRRALAASFVLPLLLSVSCQVGHTEDKANGLTVEIIGADTKDQEQEQVLSAFKKLMQGLGQRNIETISSCLSSEVIVFDSRSHRLVSGKDAVLDHINKNVLGNDKNAVAVKDFVVFNPFVDIKGDTAMVSFRAVKTMGGEKPTKMESWCSEVFERKDKEWKVLYFKSSWKPLSAHT